MKNTIISAIILSIGIVSEVWADPSGTCGSNCNWTITNGVLKITGSGAMNNYSTGGAPWYSYRSSINSIDVGSGITQLGNYAFYYLSNATSINLPNTLTHINQGALEGASKIQNLTIPNSVTSIGKAAMKNMSSVTSLEIPDSVTNIGSWVFEGMTSLRGQLVIPDSVVNIDGALLHRDHVTSLVLSDSAVMSDATAYEAFTYMGDLTDLVISDSLDVSAWGSRIFNQMAYGIKIRCQGDVNICKQNLARYGTSVTNKIYAVTDASQCTGKYKWDTASSTCRRMTENECNAVEKYYFSGGVCQNLPKTATACQNAGLNWSSNKCIKAPEKCVDYSFGACQACEDGYLTNIQGSCTPVDDCKNGFHVQGGACEENTISNCNTEADGNCSECNDGYLTNSSGTCTNTEDCKEGFFVDSESKACKPIPGCINFANGACSCENGYYKKDGSCVPTSEGCGAGMLGKNGECISAANGCGEGYIVNNGRCWRTRYTPAEIAGLVGESNTILLYYK